MSYPAFAFCTVALFAALVAGAFFLNQASCYETGDTTGRVVEWRALSGCYVESGGRMVPLDRWITAEVDTATTERSKA